MINYNSHKTYQKYGCTDLTFFLQLGNVSNIYEYKLLFPSKVRNLISYKYFKYQNILKDI